MYNTIFQRVKWFLNVKMIHLEKTKRRKCQPRLYLTLVSSDLIFQTLPPLAYLSGSTFSLQSWNKENSSKEEYMLSLISSDKIKARHWHSTKHLILIDDICTINDRGEFERSIYVIYPKELKLKVEGQGDHVTFFG